MVLYFNKEVPDSWNLGEFSVCHCCENIMGTSHVGARDRRDEERGKRKSINLKSLYII